ADALNVAIFRIQNFSAEALMVSLGVDTYKEDPISFFLPGNSRLSQVWRAVISAKSTDSFCFGRRLCAGYGGPECSECLAWL
ncbi:MAG: hypothetical protein ACO4CS_06485, partial [bacterium]